MIKKIFALTILLLSFPLFAMELEFQGHWDNYPTSNNEKDFNIGASFRFTEQLKNQVFIDANLSYKNENRYLAYCAGRLTFKKFTFLSGIALDIQDSNISPGLLFTFDTRILKSLSITTNFLTTFNSKDISKGSVFDTDDGVIFHLKNSNVKLAYNFRREIEDSYYITNHFGIFDLLTFESGFPLRIGLTIKGGLYQDSRTEENDITIEAGGRLELVTRRHGAYFVSGGARVFKKSEMDAPIPFHIGAGARFYIN